MVEERLAYFERVRHAHDIGISQQRVAQVICQVEEPVGFQGVSTRPARPSRDLLVEIGWLGLRSVGAPQ